MRPVNLMPDEVKRRTGRQGTGLAPYIVVGALGLAVIASLGFVLLNNKTSERKSEVSRLNQETEQAKAELRELEPYTRFAVAKQARTIGLTALASGRFAWSDVLSDLSKALPENAWLVDITGKLTPESKTGEKSGGGESGGQTKEESLPGPTLLLTGCTKRQKDVAKMMVRLEAIEGVSQVLLSSSEELTEQTDEGGGSSEGNEDECRTKLGIHKFEVTVAFPPGPSTALATAFAASAEGEAQSTDAKDKSEKAGSGDKAASDSGDSK